MSAPEPERASLDAVFRPRSVAVIGASRRRGTLGGEIFHNLVSHGFEGAVYPVNPHTAVVQSVRAYPSIDAVPETVDLAVLVVPRDGVLAAAQACGRAGVRALVVITAGFAETGPAGKALQDELLRTVREHGMRMVGPNCLGVLNTDPAIALDATFSPVWPLPGEVAFSSQSGALGVAILDYARSLGIGVRHFISVGNKADVSGNDLLEYWEHDPAIRVVLLYLESLGRPGRFMQLARRVSRRKPIVVVKSGRTEAGARAASSHTGSLAGLDVAVDALFEQAGVIRTDTIEELFDTALLVSRQPLPRGGRVAILTNAGGPGTMAADACAGRGLQLPRLAPETEAALRRLLPPEAAIGNPVDMIASASAAAYNKALRLLLGDPNVDAVMVLFVPPLVTEAVAVADAIRRAAEGATKPVLTCFMGIHGFPSAIEPLRAGGFPSYSFPESAAIALARVVRYGRWRERPQGVVPALGGIKPERARRVLKAGAERWLDPLEVAEVLGSYGIRLPACVSAASADAAVAAAAQIGFPVAVKLDSASITHKTDVGGVYLDLRDAEAVRQAFRSIARRVLALGRAPEMAGVTVQAMVPRGVETFVGMTLDPAFGPLLGFGLGGVNVEVWKDVVFRVHPITDADAGDMLEQVRAVKLLDGFRGAPPADRAALIDVLLRVSRMVGDLPQIVELDINPLMALAPGEGALAVDARIRVRE